MKTMTRSLLLAVFLLLSVVSARTEVISNRAPEGETSMINVKIKYGLIGDRKADDTKGLQQAFQSGMPMYIPSGLYRFTETLQVAANTKIVGDGSAWGREWLRHGAVTVLLYDGPKREETKEETAGDLTNVNGSGTLTLELDKNARIGHVRIHSVNCRLVIEGKDDAELAAISVGSSPNVLLRGCLISDEVQAEGANVCLSHCAFNAAKKKTRVRADANSRVSIADCQGKPECVESDGGSVSQR